MRFGVEAKRVTEFGATVLECDGRLEILFQTSDMAGVASSDELSRYRDRELARGCRFRAHLHNHPFNIEGSVDSPDVDIAGTTLPSFADRDSFEELAKKYGLKEARITNGFDTIRMPFR